MPDAALLVARDIVQFMLANRPDLRKELIRKKWKVAIMAVDEETCDIPEHRIPAAAEDRGRAADASSAQG